MVDDHEPFGSIFSSLTIFPIQMHRQPMLTYSKKKKKKKGPQNFFNEFYHILIMWPLFLYTYWFPLPINLALIGQVVSEMFEYNGNITVFPHFICDICC